MKPPQKMEEHQLCETHLAAPRWWEPLRWLTSSRHRRTEQRRTSCWGASAEVCRTPETEDNTGQELKDEGWRSVLEAFSGFLLNADELTKYRRLLLFHCCSGSVGRRAEPSTPAETFNPPLTRSPSFLCSASAFLAPSPSGGCLLGLLVAVAMRGTGPEGGERSGELVSVSSGGLEDCSLGTNTLEYRTLRSKKVPQLLLTSGQLSALCSPPSASGSPFLRC